MENTISENDIPVPQKIRDVQPVPILLHELIERSVLDVLPALDFYRMDVILLRQLRLGNEEINQQSFCILFAQNLSFHLVIADDGLSNITYRRFLQCQFHTYRRFFQ